MGRARGILLHRANARERYGGRKIFTNYFHSPRCNTDANDTVVALSDALCLLSEHT